jgi:TPR repeat protein
MRMAWSRRRGTDGHEPGPPAVATADALYRRAVQLSHQPGSGDAAERAAGEAVAAYRAQQRSDRDPTAPETTALQARRKLALALWRHSRLLVANHGPALGLEPAREGIALARAVLEATPSDDPGFDALIAETAMAMGDLSKTAAAAGQQSEHDALLRDAIALCEAHAGPRARQALGAILHDRAADAASAVHAGIARGQHSEAQITRALDALDKVVGVRRTLVDPGRPATQCELAGSLLMRGKLRCLLADGDGGAADLLAAWNTLATADGPDTGMLRDQLRHAMHLAEEAYPQVVATLAWPWVPAAMDRTTDDSTRSATAARWKPAMAEALRLMERGERRQAVAVLTPAAKSGANEAMHTLALLYREMGQRRRADRWLARAARAGNVEAMVIMGCNAVESGRVDAARHLLGAAAESGQPNALFNYGMLLARYLQRADEALPLWERAAEQGHTLAALNLGNVSYQIGRHSEAERWFRTGAELGNAQAMFNLALVLSATGRTSEAARWRRRGLVAQQA